MKKLYILFLLCFISFIVQGQNFNDSTYYNDNASFNIGYSSNNHIKVGYKYYFSNKNLIGIDFSKNIKTDKEIKLLWDKYDNHSINLLFGRCIDKHLYLGGIFGISFESYKKDNITKSKNNLNLGLLIGYRYNEIDISFGYNNIDNSFITIGLFLF